MDLMRPERIIRVHWPRVGNTFIVVTRGGEVAEVSLESERWALGKPERDVAEFYRRNGASFVDLLVEKSEVQVRRGYRPRALRTGEPKSSGENPRAPVRSSRGGVRKTQGSSQRVARGRERASVERTTRDVLKETMDMAMLPIDEDMPF